jgi:prepilin-type N-terminal cleavage/methylation domain-containing protein
MKTSTQKRKTGQRKAFTLIELLVVIGIIAILASLLLPALSAAKKKSKTITCIGNLKQLGAAIQMYLDDNQQTLPSVEPMPSNPVDLTNPLPRLYTVLAPHVGYKTNTLAAEYNSVFHCPSDSVRYNVEWTSYEWEYAFNGEKITDLMLGPTNHIPLSKAPLLFDFDNVHPRSSGSPKNACFGDGHAGMLVVAIDSSQ